MTVQKAPASVTLRRSLLLRIGVVTGTTCPVRAEDRNPSTVRSDGSSAKDHLRRARRARASGRWTEAHAAYKAAFEAIDSTSVTERESAEIAGELGLCEQKPVRTLQRGVELARSGRGRVFACADGFFGPLTLPSGVDLIGGFSCLNWKRQPDTQSVIQLSDRDDIVLTVAPASDGDRGAANGVSTIVDMRLRAWGPITMLVRSNTAVELIRSEIRTS